MEQYFEKLNSVNVNNHTEKKNGLTYLSWAWAWAEIKKVCPDATYKIYENELGWFYHTDGKTAWVKTGVTLNELEMIEYLPVMDYKNQSIPIDKITSFDVNKAIQRSLTKACARHGLGLYIYAGEDLPEGEEKTVTTKPVVSATKEDIGDMPIDETNVQALMAALDEKKIKVETILKNYKVESLEKLTLAQWVNAMRRLEATK